MKLGIVGYGKVGRACTEAFRQYHEVYVNDVKDIAPEDIYRLNYLIEKCDAIFVCVPTPMAKDGNADLSYVLCVIEKLSCLVSDGNKPLIVLKSTVPPQTTLELQKKYPDLRFACNPEFLREKSAYEDMMVPDRIVLGTFNKEDLAVLNRIYLRWNCPKIHCCPTTAELIKHLSNAFLTAKVAFACETAKICKIYGVDPALVFEGTSLDKRIGKSHLDPRLGPLKKSSPCLPKDILALIKNLESYGYESRLLKEVLDNGVEKTNE